MDRSFVCLEDGVMEMVLAVPIMKAFDDHKFISYKGRGLLTILFFNTCVLSCRYASTQLFRLKDCKPESLCYGRG